MLGTIIKRALKCLILYIFIHGTTFSQRLTIITDGDEVYHICLCLKYLVLHGEALAQTAHLHKGLLLWCQENVTITT